MVRRAFGVTGHHILCRGTVGGWLLAHPVLTVSVLTFTAKFLGPCWWPSPSCLWTWSCSLIQSAVCLKRGRGLVWGLLKCWTRGSRLPSLGEWRKWQAAAASTGKPPALWGHTAFLDHLCSSIPAKEEPDPSGWVSEICILF